MKRHTETALKSRLKKTSFSALRQFCSALLLSVFATSVIAASSLPTFQVVAKDGRLLPQQLEVPASQKIKIAIRNEGPGPMEFESTELRIEKVLSPGASSFVVVHPLKPGTYRIFDEFHAETSEMHLIAK